MFIRAEQSEDRLYLTEDRKKMAGSHGWWAANLESSASFRPPGTTAHVGIMLYGADSRSGHRHLDGDRAFHRNSLDIFQIATPHSLGSVWKIRVWHDNKGRRGHLPPPPFPSCWHCALTRSRPPLCRAQSRLVPAARHRPGPADRPQHLLPGQRLAVRGDGG